MNKIKKRRLTLELTSHPNLHVGECVPFYFCPRSIMLYLIHKRNHPELSYHGGQAPILHLVTDLRTTVQWAKTQDLRWAFTLSNAGSRYFKDRADLADLSDINWHAVHALDWREQRVKEGKQAEFLIERQFPWQLVTRIGVHSFKIQQQVLNALSDTDHKPTVSIERNWYY